MSALTRTDSRPFGVAIGDHVRSLRGGPVVMVVDIVGYPQAEEELGPICQAFKRLPSLMADNLIVVVQVGMGGPIETVMEERHVHIIAAANYPALGRR